jgi:hypothetical protein
MVVLAFTCSPAAVIAEVEEVVLAFTCSPAAVIAEVEEELN